MQKIVNEKNYKLKKEIKYILLVSILLISIIIVINLFKTKSYSVEYTKNNVDISENYIKEEETYFFELTHENIKYNFIVKQKSLSQSKLIRMVRIHKANDEVCLEIKSDYITTLPQCSKGNELIDFHLVSDEMKDNIKDYLNKIKYLDEEINNYKIYTNENNLITWNYKGLYKLTDNDMDYIKVFSKDIYDISLAVKINNYIIIPNYEQKYNFDEIYIISLDDNSIEKWKLKYDISFDSRVLGINDKSVFILDEKNKIEYELVPHKQKMRIVGTDKKKGIIYEYGKEVKESLTKIINDEITFKYQKDYKYEIINDNLYLKYYDSKGKIKVSNNIVDKIVDINKDNVYYISKNKLYKYNLEYGELLIAEFSEWEFNNNNMVFIN